MENPPVRVVHFRNLSDDTTQDDLLKVAKPYGRVEKTIILKQKHQAMLQFARLEDAQGFVEYYTSHPLHINRRPIYVGYSRHDELAPDKCNRILLVTFMNPNHRVMKQYFLGIITADFVQQLFSQFGPIEKVIVMSKAAGIQSLVQFANINNAITAKNSFCGYTFCPAIQLGTFTIDIQYSNLTELNIPQITPRAKDFRIQPPVNVAQQFNQNSAMAAALTAAAAMAAMGNSAAAAGTPATSAVGAGARGGAAGGFQYPLFNFPMFYPQGMMAAAAAAAASNGQRGFGMNSMMQNGGNSNGNNGNGRFGNKRYHEDRNGRMGYNGGYNGGGGGGMKGEFVQRGRGKGMMMMMNNGGGGRDRDWYNNNNGGGYRRRMNGNGNGNGNGGNREWNNNGGNGGDNNGNGYHKGGSDNVDDYDDYEMESGIKHKMMKLDYESGSSNNNGGDDYKDDGNGGGVISTSINRYGGDDNENNDDDDDDDDKTII